MGERPCSGRGAPGVFLAAALAAIVLPLLVPPSVRPAVGRTAGPAPRATKPDTTPEDTTVVYRREVFDYPAGALRNPFKPLNTGERTGPRLDDLTLVGILYSPDAGSVAVLVHPSTGRRYRLRPGEKIGDARLVRIGSDRAVFRVEAFGFDRRTVLRLQRDEERSP